MFIPTLPHAPAIQKWLETNNAKHLTTYSTLPNSPIHGERSLYLMHNKGILIHQTVAPDLFDVFTKLARSQNSTGTSEALAKLNRRFKLTF